ncbi:MAG TPA: DUF2231 domain-containing protein [Candidatus Binatia bacterium]|jgi:uncharacterized membrane protein
MSTPASIAKHPIHPMLVAVPIGLWVFSLVADLIGAAGWRAESWNDVACYTMAGGVVGALLAAIPGFIDFLSISVPNDRRIGVYHMAVNLTAVAVFSLNLYLRLSSAPGAVFPIALSVFGVALLAVAGWLGGELVYVHGMGVEQPSVARSRPEQRGAGPRKLRRIG